MRTKQDSTIILRRKTKNRIRGHDLNKCVVCGKEGDTHHIIHKDEGGLEYPLNRIYLCNEHHRGINGPHRDPEVDMKYKKELQMTLHELFPDSFYREEDIRKRAKLSNSLLRTLVKTLKRDKEGFRKVDIIDFLMSGYQLVEDDEHDFLI